MFYRLRAATGQALPLQTLYAREAKTSSVDGWSPKPTPDPLDNGLVRRQLNESICGYEYGNFSMFSSLSLSEKSTVKASVTRLFV